MAERPRDRTTVIVGWLTFAAMVIIAVVSLWISPPWQDKIPTGPKTKTHHSTPAKVGHVRAI